MTIRTIVSGGAVAVGGALLLALSAQTHLSSQSAAGSAREHDDLLASCSAEFNGMVAVHSNVRNLAGRQEALVSWDKLYAVDKVFWRLKRDEIRSILTGMKAKAPEQDPDLKAWSRADVALDTCTLTRRIAQLDGATLVSGWSLSTLPSDDASTALPLKAESQAPGANDLLWSCSAQFDALARTTPIGRQDAMRIYTGFQDLFKPNGSISELDYIQKTKIPSETRRSQAPGITPADAAVSAFHLCTLHRRLEQLAGAQLAAPPAIRTPPAASSSAARPAPPSGGATAAPVAGRPSTEPARPGRIITETPPAGHNRENEATECVELIARNQFAAKGVLSNMGGVLRNTCPYKIDVIWCIVGGDCNPGYSNLWSIAANKDWPINAPADRHFDAKWAACKNPSGFQSGQAARSVLLKHACK